MTTVYHPHIPDVALDVDPSRLAEYLAMGWRENDPFHPAPQPAADEADTLGDLNG